MKNINYLKNYVFKEYMNILILWNIINCKKVGHFFHEVPSVYQLSHQSPFSCLSHFYFDF